MTRVPKPAEQFIRRYLGLGIAEIIESARMSALAKTDEIMTLRADVCSRSSELMMACARQAATRFAAGGRLLTFGNGGSATDAQHLAMLFMCPGGAYRSLSAICLVSDVAVLTGLSNDVGLDVVFARQIASLAKPGDIAVGLSTIGNCENLVQAFDEAKQRGLMTVAIAGEDGGKLAELGSLDYLFLASSSSVHRIQEAQTTIYQILWELIVGLLDSPEGTETPSDLDGLGGVVGALAGT